MKDRDRGMVAEPAASRRQHLQASYGISTTDVTGLSGNGSGLMLTFIEVMVDSGLVGLPRTVAGQMAVQTAFGTARLMHESGEQASALKGKVTSPGGTTITGLQQLENTGFRRTLMAAVEAATMRSRELDS